MLLRVHVLVKSEFFSWPINHKRLAAITLQAFSGVGLVIQPVDWQKQLGQANLNQIVTEGGGVPHITEFCRTDAVDRTIVKLTPVAQCCHHNAGIHVV